MKNNPIEKRATPLMNPTSNWKFLNEANKTTKKNHNLTKSRFLRNSKLGNSKQANYLGSTIKTEKNYQTDKQISNGILDNSDLQIVERTMISTSISNEIDNISRLNKAKMLKKASSSDIKKEPLELQKHSTFDAINFDDDTDDFWDRGSQHIPIFENTEKNHFSSTDQSIEMNISVDDEPTSNIKCLIREDILAKAKSASSSPQRFDPTSRFTVYQDPSKKKSHLLNVFELIGGNDIPLEEKHQRLPRGHDRESDLNDPERISEMRIAKQMKAYFDEQGIDAPAFLDNPVPQARPNSREESKSLYD